MTENRGSEEHRLQLLREKVEDQLVAVQAAVEALQHEREQLARNQREMLIKLGQNQQAIVDRLGELFQDMLHKLGALMVEGLRRELAGAGETVREQLNQSLELVNRGFDERLKLIDRANRDLQGLQHNLASGWKKTLWLTAGAVATAIVVSAAGVGFVSIWWAQRELDGLYAMRLREAAALAAVRKEAEQLPEPVRRQPQGQPSQGQRPARP